MKKKAMRLAAKLSEHSEHKYQVGAVIMRGNRILGLGFNQVKTHPKSTHPFKTCHAETVALLQCQREDTKGATCYVYRRLKDGTASMSRPCPSCEAMLKERGINTVYYTTSNNAWVKEKYK